MKNKWIVPAVLAVLAMAQNSCGKKMTAETYFADADTLRVHGKLSDAVRKLSEIPDKFPLDTLSTIKSLTLTADIYAADLHDFNKAIECHEKILEKFPDHTSSPKSMIIIAVTYENELKNLEKAKFYYESFLKKYPGHELAPGVKGALDLLGISDEELEKRILEKNPKSGSAAE